MEEYYKEHVKFPDSLNRRVIEPYLNRRLTSEEKDIIEHFKEEYMMNEKLKSLYENCKQQNLFCPVLTSLDGNCLFESLVYYRISDSVEQLRKYVSFLLHTFKNYKNFIPGTNDTLEEIFTMANEIEYVKCNSGVYYKYTYDVMCQDVSNMNAWSKLPTQLILMVLSYVFKLEFVILNNNGDYVNKINVFENVENNETKVFTIYLGHIQEAHYIPLDINTKNSDFILYDECKNNLHRWVKHMESIKFEECKKYFNCDNNDNQDI